MVLPLVSTIVHLIPTIGTSFELNPLGMENPYIGIDIFNVDTLGPPLSVSFSLPDSWNAFVASSFTI